MEFLTNADSVINVIAADPTTAGFGINGIEKKPFQVPAVLLPQAKMRYAGNQVSSQLLLLI